MCRKLYLRLNKMFLKNQNGTSYSPIDIVQCGASMRLYVVEPLTSQKYTFVYLNKKNYEKVFWKRTKSLGTWLKSAQCHTHFSIIANSFGTSKRLICNTYSHLIVSFRRYFRFRQWQIEIRGIWCAGSLTHSVSGGRRNNRLKWGKI